MPLSALTSTTARYEGAGYAELVVVRGSHISHVGASRSRDSANLTNV
jgi:hypothetical protein